jgi:hypothetical protein
LGTVNVPWAERHPGVLFAIAPENWINGTLPAAKIPDGRKIADRKMHCRGRPRLSALRRKEEMLTE